MEVDVSNLSEEVSNDTEVKTEVSANDTRDSEGLPSENGGNTEENGKGEVEVKMSEATHSTEQTSHAPNNTSSHPPILIHIQKKRNRSRDDLTLSPDLTKTGKRQRRSNSIYNDFEIDKKTQHVFGAEKEEETPSTPPVTIHPVVSKKEVFLSPTETKTKKLPKGYFYEIVPAPVTQEVGEELPAKRERKKISYKDMAEPEKDIKPIDTPKPEPGKRGRKKGFKLNKPKKPVEPQVDEELASQLLKKQELENQLKALTEKLNNVSQTLENKTKQIQLLESKEKEVTEGGSLVGSSDERKEATTEVSIALPSGTIIRQTIKKKQGVPKKAKRGASVYDRFDSDDDLPEPKKRAIKTSPPSSKGRPKRNRKAINFDDEDSDVEEEKETAPAPVTPKLPKAPKEPKVEEEIIVPEEFKGCLKILLQLRRHRYAWPFNVPVDPVALNIPDYTEIIKEPMDFGTILDKMKEGKYEAVNQFGEDVRLVFKNAVTYNAAGSDICIMANTLSGLFEKQFARLGGPPPISGVVSPRVTSPPISSPPLNDEYRQKTKEQLTNTINDIKDSMRFVRDEISKLRKEKPQSSPAPPAVASPRGRPPPRPRDETSRDMTFEEKRQLSISINNLPPENLGRIVQIIHQRMPNLAQNSPDEIEIDIDALDTGTLRALDKYVKSVQTKPKKKRDGPNLPKNLLAEQAAQNTSKSIQDVKRKLEELKNKTGTNKKSNKNRKKDNDEDALVDIDDNTPPKVYQAPNIEKDDDDSSSSDSSSETGSSSSDSSDSEEEKKESKAKADNVTIVEHNNNNSQTNEKPEQDQRDSALPSPEREPIPSKMEIETPSTESKPAEAMAVEPAEEPAAILPSTVKKEVELKNLDSWTNFDVSTEESTANSEKKDDTWAQFQNRDLKNKMREKQREEEEEKEKQLKAQREAERRRQEEQRLKELADLEEKKKMEEEEAKRAAERELAQKRAEEKRLREQASQNSINMLDQSMLMSSFEMSMGMNDMPFKLKEEGAAKEGQ